MQLWIREHLTSPIHTATALDTERLVIAEEPSNARVLTNQTITTTGQVFTGPADPQYCAPGVDPQRCQEWLGTLGLRQDLTYHPTSHFWTLQWIEAGIFVALAAVLVRFCFWWIRRVS